MTREELERKKQQEKKKRKWSTLRQIGEVAVLLATPLIVGAIKNNNKKG